MNNINYNELDKYTIYDYNLSDGYELELNEIKKMLLLKNE